MSESQSDKSLLRGVNAGTASGAEKLDREFRQKLHALADRGMDNRLRRREDPEDIVQSVLGTVFRRAAQGQLHFEHTSELWKYRDTILVSQRNCYSVPRFGSDCTGRGLRGRRSTLLRRAASQ